MGSPLLLLAAPLVCLLALAFRSTALLGMGLAWFGLLALAHQMGRGRLAGLSARREVYGSAFENDEVAVEIVLENRRPRAVHLIEIVDRFGPAHAEHQVVLEAGPLGARRRRRLLYRTSCSRHWGIYAVGPVSLRVSDPFGLFRFHGPPGDVEPFAVYPRVHEVGALDRFGGRTSLAPEERSEARSGQGADFLGVRDYRAGDDPRRIHWPATAHRGTPVVREHELDLAPYFTLFLDLERSRRAGTGLKSTREYVVRAAASLLWSAVGRGDFVQVFADGREPLHLPPGSGQVHLTWSLYELIRSKQDGRTPILDLVEREAQRVPARSTAVLLTATTDLAEERLAAIAESFRARRTHLAVLAVEQDTFVPYDKLAPPRDSVAQRGRELVAFLRGHGVPAAVLNAEADLARELARPDLFDSASPFAEAAG